VKFGRVTDLADRTALHCDGASCDGGKRMSSTGIMSELKTWSIDYALLSKKNLHKIGGIAS
jgi:hypothetical protein